MAHPDDGHCAAAGARRGRSGAFATPGCAGDDGGRAGGGPSVRQRCVRGGCGGGSGPRAAAGEAHGAGAAAGARAELAVESGAGGMVGESCAGFDVGQQPRPPAGLVLSGYVVAASSARAPLKLLSGAWSS
jgi:hypothetical protein